MAQLTEVGTTPAIAHRGEERSNEVRRRLLQVEPLRAADLHAQPGRAGQQRRLLSLDAGRPHAGRFHLRRAGGQPGTQPDALVAAGAGVPGPGIDRGRRASSRTAVPLTAYNAITEIEMEATERLIASLQGQPGGARCEQVLWAASGSEAIQKALWAALDRRPGRRR